MATIHFSCYLEYCSNLIQSLKCYDFVENLNRNRVFRVPYRPIDLYFCSSFIVHSLDMTKQNSYNLVLYKTMIMLKICNRKVFFFVFIYLKFIFHTTYWAWCWISWWNRWNWYWNVILYSFIFITSTWIVLT